MPYVLKRRGGLRLGWGYGYINNKSTEAATFENPLYMCNPVFVVRVVYRMMYIRVIATYDMIATYDNMNPLCVIHCTK